ncbi:uncharacterized protein LOC132256320 [Phlebotomus argentipes]|uniref:uncharacterized protein LOC132256320 n=1 Tax=Phlebotomus argentipes TaxID=94469 RepID=UPI002893780A|nr:uncharacterized protein LOC132256320 [Phlebotomus argentipes]
MCFAARSSDNPAIRATKSAQESLAVFLFDICQDCLTMPSLPQGAFAACKVGQKMNSEKESAVMRRSALFGQDKQHYSNNKKLMEYTPAKYNGKMMMSIWGLYNKYSPHNIKNVSDADEAWKVAPEQGKYFTAQNVNDTRSSFWDATATFPRH